MRELSDALKRRALEAGADLVGLAPAQPMRESAAYRAWVDQGMQGSMGYMARDPEARQDIRGWFPAAKSVLLTGFRYAGAEPGEPGQGRLAAYARLPDYHPELKKRLKGVLAWFQGQVPVSRGKVFVDTSPLLERLYGRYAGLGWVGKNTMLIAPKLGSYFFLCGIALDSDLAYDEPAPDHCGSCRRCLDACPTEAFPKERVLDASRCISYFTIEHREAIPEGFRKGIGDWIMGCDVCQEVCPWNRFSLAGGAFSPVLGPSLDLSGLTELDESSFKARFSGTPLERTKRRGLMRNALLAMGNSKDPSHRPALERALADPDPVLSEQAAWSLARLDETAAA